LVFSLAVAVAKQLKKAQTLAQILLKQLTEQMQLTEQTQLTPEQPTTTLMLVQTTTLTSVELAAETLLTVLKLAKVVLSVSHKQTWLDTRHTLVHWFRTAFAQTSVKQSVLTHVLTHSR